MPGGRDFVLFFWPMGLALEDDNRSKCNTCISWRGSSNFNLLGL